LFINSWVTDMQNVTTWVIDFGRRASMAGRDGSDSEALETFRMVASQRRRSREMFAATRALLAEAQAVLATGPVPARGTSRQRGAAAAR
jgi:hypothetical protein